MSQRRERGGLRRRAVSLLLAVVMLVTLAQSAIVSAASYVEPYLNQVVEWGVMRGDIDGNLNPDNPISRAEFVTMINRAYGFTQMGTMPFTDVPEKAWYAEDVNIAYHTGYIQGTSSTTFSPSDSITREQATVILARILMMQAQVGENVDFNDSRDMNDWSRGLIATAADYGLIDGYSDGSFRPQNPITRGEASILLVRAVGTPILEPGEYRIGNTWGNVTISSSGVTLRDTVIGGNLYVSAGVDLGDVVLENVKVLGEIIVSGGGVSEDGDDSVILRNVTAPKLILDNFTGQTVSVRVEGDGLIQQADVRTNAFLADNAKDGYGVSQVRLDGEDGLSLTLAGNIKEVTNVTPGSTVSLASGQAAVINVDEKATDSVLRIETGALAHEVNLDTATTVTGNGDISNLVVNSSGSTVSMLPDQIVIRPGETANIGGELMDSNAAAESSADPRQSAGYPRISDLAPTSVTAQFSANKKGIVYWAITAITDGSVAAEDLINPSSYSPKIVKSGSLSLDGAGQVNAANITGLTTNGSYYLSAVFVDGREQRSPLKVISFTTPDNTKPDFATGYPYMSKITNISGQVTTMATKTCRMYWAVLPKGATAPTESDFKANAVSGNLGFGVLDVTKNVSNTFDVNSVPLEELESYDLYLWLTDVDGGQSSAVKKLSFTTVDGTPPVFNTEPTINKVDKTSVGLYANLNEDGTLYWVIVEEGVTYPKPLAGQSGAVDLTSDEAKLQVSAGMNALKSGTVTMTKDKDVTFTVSGLEEEKAYDLYYVAKDKAGNFSASVGKITIHTLDNTAPTVTQEFTKYNGTDVNVPLPESDVRLVFSEAVQTADSHETLVSLYQNVTANLGTAGETDARNDMGLALSKAIYLYQVPANTQPVKIEGATDADKTGDNWTIDYRYATVTLEEGKTVVTFPNGTGINFKSGATYYFEIQADTIADTSSAFNVMGRQQLDRFTTVFAQVNLSALNENTITTFEPPTPGVEETPVQKDVPVDVSWRLTPVSTQKVDDSIDWDMLIWSDTSVEFELYYRNTVPAGEPESQNEWHKLGSASITVPDNVTGYRGVSLTRNFLESGSNNPDFDMLNTLQDDAVYEYAISFTKVAGLPDRDTWSQRVNLKVHVIAGSNNDLGFLSADLTEENWEESLTQGVTNIGLPADFSLRKQFTDQQAPEFIGEYPKFEAGDSAVEMSLMLDRPGTVYYVVAPINTVSTVGTDGTTNYGVEANWQTLPESGAEDENEPPDVATPDYLNIVNASTVYRNEKIKYGSAVCGASVEPVLVEGLDKLTQYTVYFVLQGTSQTYSRVLVYRFTTTDVSKPAITLTQNSPSVNFETDSSAELNYALIANNEVPESLRKAGGFDATLVDQSKLETWNELTDPTDGEYKDAERSVLWALCTPYGTDGYSVFDEFANTSIRKTVSELVDGTNRMGATIADQGKMTLEQANDYFQSKDFTDKMTGDTLYYCLATAVSPLGSEMSFAGVPGVYIPDRTPPELNQVNTSATLDPGGNTYSGTVTFVFSEPVYQLVTEGGVDQKPKEVWQTQYTTTDDAVRLKDIMGTSQSKSKFSYPNDIKAPASTLTLEFKEIPLGTTIVLFDTSYICDANSNSTRELLTFTLQEGVPSGHIPNGIGFVQQTSTP
ncbi:S-layer homology domain-containing protein [Flavonifractor sp. An306]|uniref:S-layer homology domain-containing protein n=1 Tax=Flavonifractor sp. An306 TaxID=1965629 RepID=UPI000B381259|nr:S-layer homology domain-containing protein [Flavonifractor sp. An306]OUO41304.1 hypothetical protein B5F88_06750 [Flavonifractor sp. An306]